MKHNIKLATESRNEKQAARAVLGILDSNLDVIRLAERSPEALIDTIRLISASDTDRREAHEHEIDFLLSKITQERKGRAKANKRADDAEAMVRALQHHILTTIKNDAQ
jgi:methionyl-tRNA formyltransferase